MPPIPSLFYKEILSIVSVFRSRSYPAIIQSVLVDDYLHKFKVLLRICTVLIQRTLSQTALQALTTYPALTITGPRQSGKTTLVKELFPEKPYVNFEKPDTREFFESDPKGFLAPYAEGGVFDEVQRVPKLASYLQAMIDETRRTGMFVLTGSTQHELLRQVGQSLAGRTAVLTLLPFSIDEIGSALPSTLDETLRTGFYPPIFDRGIESARFYSDYVQTYLERDVRQILEIRNLSAFQRFLRLCAGRVGQLVNLESLAADTGVSGVTVRQWLSVLEASFIVAFLRPWYENLGKRLVKSPKLYFVDTGLAAWLCGIEEPSHVPNHPLRGSLFENMIVMEAFKRRYSRGKSGDMSFFRDSRGMEVDLLYPDGPVFVPVEIKSAQTVAAEFFSGIEKLQHLAPERFSHGRLIYGGAERQARAAADVVPWREIGSSLP
jgi:predicted AAA+ superfamily ATPase